MACTKCSGHCDCEPFFLPLNDLLRVLSGKWKMRLILCIASEGKRFNEMKNCHKISPRILSKELKELELNGIISRTEMNDNLKTVNYDLTDIGAELVPIILQFQKWGSDYREMVLQKMESDN